MEIQRLFKPLLFISLGITPIKFLAAYNGINIPLLLNFA